MHAHAIVALLVLAGSPGSAPVGGAERAPPVSGHHHVQVQNAAALISSFVTEEAFTITTAHWVTHSTGVGLGSQTLSLVVDGATLCTITVACLAAPGTTVTETCSARIASGQSVTWRRGGCATAALGAITYCTTSASGGD